MVGGGPRRVRRPHTALVAIAAASSRSKGEPCSAASGGIYQVSVRVSGANSAPPVSSGLPVSVPSSKSASATP